MQHIDLFEVPGGELVLVPDEGETLYLYHPAFCLTFAYDAMRLIEDEDHFRATWRTSGTTETRATSMDLLQHKDAVHLADYTRLADTERYTEDALHVFPRRFDGSLSKQTADYLGPLVARLAQRVPLPDGPCCHRCSATTEVIGLAEIEPYGSHRIVQHTVMHQCWACGQYRQTGFEDGSDWIDDRLDYRAWVRLLPDPYVRNGRLRMTYEAGGQRLNLDGTSLHAGQMFELYDQGRYRAGSIERGAGGFFFHVSGTEDIIDLLPGMQGRLLQK